MVVPAVLVEMAFVRKTREAGAAGDSNRSVVAELKGAAAAVRKGNGGEPLASCFVPFSSHLQSFPASGSFQMSQFFTSGGQSTPRCQGAPGMPQIPCGHIWS